MSNENGLTDQAREQLRKLEMASYDDVYSEKEQRRNKRTATKRSNSRKKGFRDESTDAWESQDY